MKLPLLILTVLMSLICNLKAVCSDILLVYPTDPTILGYVVSYTESSSIPPTTVVYPLKMQPHSYVGYTMVVKISLNELKPNTEYSVSIQSYNALFQSDPITTTVLSGTTYKKTLKLTCNLPQSFEIDQSHNLNTWSNVATLPPFLSAHPISGEYTTNNSVFFRGTCGGYVFPWSLSLSVVGESPAIPSNSNSQLSYSYYTTNSGTSPIFGNYTGVAAFTNTVTTNRWFVPPTNAVQCTVSDLSGHLPLPGGGTIDDTFINVVRRRDGYAFYGTNSVVFPITRTNEQYRISFYTKSNPVNTNKITCKLVWE